MGIGISGDHISPRLPLYTRQIYFRVIPVKNIIYIILTLMASPLSAETVAITDQASQLKFPGKFVWADLLTTEPEKAARFYETVFGWEASIVDEEYLILYNKGKRIGGIARRVALGRQYIDHDHLV